VKRAHYLLTFAVAFLALSRDIAAAERDVIEFDIPVQRADIAITSFAQQAGLTVLFPFDIVSRRITNPLAGAYELREALDILLEGTGLVASLDEPGRLIVRAAEEGDLDDGDGDEAEPHVDPPVPGSRPRRVRPPASRAIDPMEEVLVTGSRIPRRDFDANSPIMSVGVETLDSTSAISIEQTLNRLPQFVPAVTQFAATDYQAQATNTPGSMTLSLRGLGANRNLVLLDGRRAMPVNASMAVDINTIPRAVIERVETITGGASSVYGADAMAGVVNFILRKDFEGVGIDAQYGGTQHGGGEEYRVSTLFGMSSANDDGNVWFGFERASREKVLEADRAFFRDGWADPTVDGTEDFHTAPGFQPDPANPVSQAAVDRIFADAPGAVSPASIFSLNADGTLYTTTPGGAYRYNGPTIVDGHVWRFTDDSGALEENMLYRPASLPMDRYSLFGRGRYDLNDRASLFAQGMYSRSKTHTQDDYSPMLGGWRARVPGAGSALYVPSVDESGNTRPDYLPGGRFGLECPPVGGCTYAEAFPVPAELDELLASRADPTAPWDVRQSTTWADSPRSTDNVVTWHQLVVGMQGTLPTNDWSWELHASHGATAVTTSFGGFMSLARWRHLVAQPNYGRNFFYTGNELGDGFGAGTGSCTTGLPVVEIFEPSQDCKDAVVAPLNNASEMVQNILELNLQGELAETRAGAVRFAVGASARRNRYEFRTDVLSSQQSFQDQAAGLFPASNTAGETRVREVYGELLVPLVGERAWTESLNLELGYRTSRNDPGDSVGTHKTLIDWSLTDRIRIRGGRQVANRAPNVGELFLSRTQTWATSGLGDFCSERNPTNPLSANPALNPNADRVRAICESRMGPEGAASYYDPANAQPDLAFAWRFANTVGNRNLRSETAKTATLGVVTSIGERGALTVDWWKIEIRDMIAAQSVDTIYTNCMSPATNPGLDPSHPACQRIVRDPVDGAQSAVDVTYTNEGAVNASGIDVQLDWQRDLAAGALSLSFLATVLETMETRIAPMREFNDWKGTLGPNDVSGIEGGSYDYKTYTTLGYFRGSWSVMLTWRHLPSIASAASVLDPNDTSAPAASYDIFDLAGSYRPSDQWGLRYGIENLLDAEPVRTFPDQASTGAGMTTPKFYDVLGRRAYVGFELRL